MATSTAICTVSAFDWSFNSLGQSPCLVGAYLGGVCNAGQFTVTPLAVDRVYLGPTLVTANACRCSSVFYSLISACAGCQGREYLHWSSYNQNCSTVYPSIFDRAIPAGTKVPHYAYLNVTADDTFNITAAMLALDAPESTAAVPQSTGGFPSPSNTAGTTSPSSSSSKGSSKAGPIAGGVVGGVVGLALIAALIFWWTRRRRTRTAPSSEVAYVSAPPSAPTPMSYNTTTPSFSANNMSPQKLYDPADPTTYPSSPQASSGVFNSSSQALHPNITGSTYTSTFPAPQGGRYTGAPEL